MHFVSLEATVDYTMDETTGVKTFGQAHDRGRGGESLLRQTAEVATRLQNQLDAVNARIDAISETVSQSTQDANASVQNAHSDWAYAHMAISNFIQTFAFVKADRIDDLHKMSMFDLERLMKELAWRALARGRVDALASATNDSWFDVSLNGVKLTLPRYTLMTMRHCINGSSDGQIGLLVETAHWEKLRSHLVAGSLFLDIGASTGAMSVPFALAAENTLRIAAFEPSRQARSYLEATIVRNNAKGVTAFPFALSDTVGRFEFVEFPEDATGKEPYLPETSRLSAATDALVYPEQKFYPVDVTTVDQLREELDFASARNIVVKIDVEGFEDKVLMGALETLRRFKPFLSIDIHPHPGTSTMTDTACQEILSGLGYRLERIGHVMLGYPE